MNFTFRCVAAWWSVSCCRWICTTIYLCKQCLMRKAFILSLFLLHWIPKLLSQVSLGQKQHVSSQLSYLVSFYWLSLHSLLALTSQHPALLKAFNPQYSPCISIPCEYLSSAFKETFDQWMRSMLPCLQPPQAQAQLPPSHWGPPLNC